MPPRAGAGGEAGIEFGLADIDRISRRTPQIAEMRPAGRFMMQDLDVEGGVPVVMRELLDAILIDGDALTVTGQTMAEALAGVGRSAEPRTPVFHTVEDPVKQTGGLSVLWGNLAPDGSVIKVANQASNRHRGPVRVFDTEQEAFGAVGEGKIVAGDVVVVRYQGPKGGPGMPEMTHLTSAIVGAGLVEETALLTDGRFGGGTQGISVGHISPRRPSAGRSRSSATATSSRSTPRRTGSRSTLGRRDRGQARGGGAPAAAPPDRRPRQVRAARRLCRDRCPRRGLTDGAGRGSRAASTRSRSVPGQRERIGLGGCSDSSWSMSRSSSPTARSSWPTQCGCRGAPCVARRPRPRERRPFLAVGETVEEIAPDQRDAGCASSGGGSSRRAPGSPPTRHPRADDPPGSAPGPRIRPRVGVLLEELAWRVRGRGARRRAANRGPCRLDRAPAGANGPSLRRRPGLRLTLDLSHFELQSVTLDRMLTLVPSPAACTCGPRSPARSRCVGATTRRTSRRSSRRCARVGYAGAYCVEYVPMPKWRCDEMDVVTEALATRTACASWG